MENLSLRQWRSIRLLNENLNKLKQIMSAKRNILEYDIKKEFYRPLAVLIKTLGLYFNVNAVNCFELINKLSQNKHINRYHKKKLNELLLKSLGLRLTYYFEHDCQKDDLKLTNPDEELQNFSREFLEIFIEINSIISAFY